MGIRIYSPEGALGTPPVVLTPAPRRLTGLPVGILDNGKPNADVLLRTVSEGLAARAKTTLGPSYRKNAARPAPDDQIKGLAREVKVVLTGSAD